LLPPTAGTLPVANVILPGPPAAYTGLLHGERYAVAATLDRETRYWLRVGGHFAIASVSDIGIAAGDLLLMETSRDHLDRADIVAGQLCTIAISSESGVTHAFARIALEAGKLLAWVYDDQFATGDAGTNKGTARAVLLESMINPSRMRITKARKKSSTQVASEGALAPQGEYRAFPASDHPAVRQLTGTNEIVGIALLLQRPLIPLQARLPSHAHVGNQEDLNDRETEVASQENELQVVDAPNVASVTVVARRGN